MHWMDGHGFFMGGMWIVWALLLVALALVVLAGIRRTGGGRGSLGIEEMGGESDAEQVLKRRLARGEISEEEFESRLHHMRA